MRPVNKVGLVGGLLIIIGGYIGFPPWLYVGIIFVIIWSITIMDSH